MFPENFSSRNTQQLKKQLNKLLKQKLKEEKEAKKLADRLRNMETKIKALTIEMERIEKAILD